MYADSNESGQSRLEWLKILEMLWSLMYLIFKTSSVTPDFFYVFSIILSFSTCSQSFKKICTWEVLGTNVLKFGMLHEIISDCFAFFRVPIAWDILVRQRRIMYFMQLCLISLIVFLVSELESASLRLCSRTLIETYNYM